LLTTTATSWRRLGHWGSGGGGDRRRRPEVEDDGGGDLCSSVRSTREGARRREAPAALREEDGGFGARPGPAAATSFFIGRPWRGGRILLVAVRAQGDKSAVWKGVLGGSISGFIRGGRERATARGQLAIDGHGAGGFNSNSRGARDGEGVTEGVIEGK
jgi:hypothetical protein